MGANPTSRRALATIACDFGQVAPSSQGEGKNTSSTTPHDGERMNSNSLDAMTTYPLKRRLATRSRSTVLTLFATVWIGALLGSGCGGRPAREVGRASL